MKDEVRTCEGCFWYTEALVNTTNAACYAMLGAPRFAPDTRCAAYGKEWHRVKNKQGKKDIEELTPMW